MSDERCELTDLLVSSCSHCRPNREMERIVGEMNPPPRPFGTWRSERGNGAKGKGLPFAEYAEDTFSAKMPDTCVSCGGRIAPGDDVRRALSYNTGVIHRLCP
jgi:hypothetical protein